MKMFQERNSGIGSKQDFRGDMKSDIVLYHRRGLMNVSYAFTVQLWITVH
jgi:hypothetical protein